jgi:hypothetical protein
MVKKIFFILNLLLLPALQIVLAQVEKSPTVQFLNKRGYVFPDSTTIDHRPDSLKKWPDSVYYNTAYKSTLLGTPTIPISFSRLEVVNGKYQLSPTISLGYGYAWFFGKFYFNENDKILVDPNFLFGLIGDVSLQNDFSLKKFTGIFTGAFIGFGNFNIFAGYDYLNSSATLGIGGRIDVYTFRQDKLKPIGKVREVRPHKKVATKIENE